MQPSYTTQRRSALSGPNRAVPHPEPIRWARVLADTLTFSRLVGGVLVATWPWQPSARSLAALFRCKILLWSADAIDGTIARRSNTPPSWIGRHDIWIDAFVTMCTGVALGRMGLVPTSYVAAWTVACALLYWIRPVHTVLLVFMLPLHLAVVFLAVARRLPEVWLFALWLATLAFLARRRLKWVIGVFVDGLPDGPRRWVLSWLPGFVRLTPEERAVFEMQGKATPGDTIHHGNS